MQNRLLAYCLAVLLVAPAHAIIIRHDRPDAAYRAMAASVLEPVAFPGADGVVQGMGTPVAPQWVLTAAHVADVLAPGDPVQHPRGMGEVAAVVMHPAWRPGRPGDDIALVRLAAPIPGAVLATLHEGSDEAGLVVTFVGRGDTGDGMTGVAASDGVLRAALNRVESARGEWLRFTFDQGDAALPLEGISGPGDSGGPALVRRGDAVHVVGVSAWQDTAPAGGVEGRYGVVEVYSRVSHHLAWLRGVMAGDG